MHKHTWIASIDGYGELPKHNTPNPQYMKGKLVECACGEQRFQPDAFPATTVKIERT
jgi:hypothetical protein